MCGYLICVAAFTDDSFYFFLSQEHPDYVNDLKFDDFQIVSCSDDDSILIWDFLDPIPPGPMQTDQSKAKKHLT